MARKQKRMDRLTLDSIAAEKAGMSYGQYKAQHPHTPDGIEVEPVQEEPTGKCRGVCAWCGSEFFYTKISATRKYCPGKDCDHHAALARNREYARSKKKAAIGKEMVCEICGKVIPTGSGRTKYCSKECYTTGQRRNYKKRKGETNGNIEIDI